MVFKILLKSVKLHLMVLKMVAAHHPGFLKMNI